MSGGMFSGIGVSAGRHSVKDPRLILRMERISYDLRTHRGQTGEELASRDLLQLRCVKTHHNAAPGTCATNSLRMSGRPSYTHRFGKRPSVGDLIPEWGTVCQMQHTCVGPNDTECVLLSRCSALPSTSSEQGYATLPIDDAADSTSPREAEKSSGLLRDGANASVQEHAPWSLSTRTIVRWRWLRRCDAGELLFLGGEGKERRLLRLKPSPRLHGTDDISGQLTEVAEN